MGDVTYTTGLVVIPPEAARIAWIGGQAAGGGMITSPVLCVTRAMADLGHAPHSAFAKAASSSALAASGIGTIAPSGRLSIIASAVDSIGV